MSDLRLIEYLFPIEDVSINSAYEKNLTRNTLSSTHLWWARRPLSSSLSTNFASLIDIPPTKQDRKELLDLIDSISDYNKRKHKQFLNQAKKIIRENYPNSPPRVLDPFTGGGSIPLEALRLGCDTYANDYNPISVLINKCLLMYCPNYGEKLLNRLEEIASVIYKNIEKKTRKLYPKVELNYQTITNEKKQIRPVYYLWYRHIKCPNPFCNSYIPLVKNFWVSKTKKQRYYVKPSSTRDFAYNLINADKTKETSFDPDTTTVFRSRVKCPKCGNVTDRSQLMELFNTNEIIEMPILGIGLNGKMKEFFEIDNSLEMQEVELLLESEIDAFITTYGFYPFPQDEIPKGNGRGAERAFSVYNYGFKKWEDLFNVRQKLVLLYFLQEILDAVSYTHLTLPTKRIV